MTQTCSANGTAFTA